MDELKEKYPKTYAYVLKNTTTDIRCNRCNAVVLLSELRPKYKYQCMACDEDMFEIEVHDGDLCSKEEFEALVIHTAMELGLDE